MSASSRDNYRAKQGKKNPGPSFVQLYHHLVDSAAWHELSPLGRLAYLEMARLYDGLNNGRLAMSVRRLAEYIPCGKNAASRALLELENNGFIAAAKIGAFSTKQRHSSEYRLTCYRCDVTGRPPTKDFAPGKKWKPQQSAQTKPKPGNGTVPPKGTDGPSKGDRFANDGPPKGDRSVPPKGTEHANS